MTPTHCHHVQTGTQFTLHTPKGCKYSKCWHPTSTTCKHGVCNGCIKGLPIITPTPDESNIINNDALIRQPNNRRGNRSQARSTLPPSAQPILPFQAATPYQADLNDSATLDDLISQCPPVNPLSTPVYPNRSVSGRFGIIYTSVLLTAISSWSIPDPNSPFRTSRIMQLTPVLTLRSPIDNDENFDSVASPYTSPQ
jgi:hypothetical protein